MKHSVGQKVKIRSLEWYRDNVNRYGIIECGKYEFFEPMNEYCGKVVTIKRIDDDNYRIDADKGAFCWTDEMIECKVKDEVGLVDNLSSRWVNEFNLPDGYIFKDENGNVINAQKIVLEKKKEYPKTIEECKDKTVAGSGYKTASLLTQLERLLICRDAYWKLYGDEIGLGKPWKPDFSSHEEKFSISVFDRRVVCIVNQYDNIILTFPTREMRDAFYENFKELIESCKELL